MFIALAVNTLILIVYGVLIAAVLYHYRRYNLPNDPRRWVITIFLIMMAILFILSYLIIIFFIDWSALRLSAENILGLI